ncbi:VWA domain-containing protein [Candidatus Saccharibacteria bacterium]|nr:VWA domain-containing protein [Candidatus Saccharibacteria bacterium]
MRYSWLFILPIFAIIAIVSYSLYRFYSKERTVKKVVMVSHSKKIRNLPEYDKARTRYRILLVAMVITFTVSLISVTISASRPISVGVVEPEYSTRDVMLCIDVSGSTSSSREDLIKYLGEVVEQLDGQRVGVTIFATKATLLSPLTSDYASLHSTLEMLRSSFYFNGQSRVSFYTDAVGYTSNIGTGVVNCINNFDQLQNKERSLSMIVATDNGQTEGSITIEKAANYARRYGITMYGIDTEHVNTGANLPANSKAFKAAVLNTGGTYYSLSASGLSTDEVVDEILKQESVKHESERKYVHIDSPVITTTVAAISTVLFLIIAWRIRL